MTSLTLLLAGRAAMLPSSKADPDHGRCDPEPASQRVVARRGGRNTQVFSFPLAQPQRCCCCGFGHVPPGLPRSHLCKAPGAEECWAPAPSQALRPTGANTPTHTRTHCWDPHMQDGAHTCCIPSSARGNLQADGPAVVGRGWEITCVYTQWCLPPASTLCSAPLRSALLLRGTCNYPDQAPCHSSARGVESSCRQ